MNGTDRTNGTDGNTLLILADGRILARNVTPPIAELLLALQPGNQELAARVCLSPP